MARSKSRIARRARTKLLTSYRGLDGDVITASGFARTLNLGETGALIESPDRFQKGQTLSLEFLLDYNRIARVEGRVTRISKAKGLYHISVAFYQVAAAARRLIARQIAQVKKVPG